METKLTTTPLPPRSIVPVDFAKKRRTLQHLGRSVYAYPEPCTRCGSEVTPKEAKCPKCGTAAPDFAYYERPYVNGRQTVRRLEAKTLRSAQLQVGKLRSEAASARLGRAPDPYAAGRAVTVKVLAAGYIADGCPKRDKTLRSGKQLQDELRNVQNLVKHMGNTRWVRITFEDLEDYHAQRTAEIQARPGEKRPGHRVVDIEERTLSSILRWAQRHTRKTGVTHNPVGHDRPSHCIPHTIRHCRDVMPETGDELHQLARYLLADEKSEVLAWQMLFEALIGHRTAEILRLRMDAKARYEPGFVEGTVLYLYRSHTAKGTDGHREIHAALKACLAAHRHWHAHRFPKGSPWYFPSPYRAGANCVTGEALTRALRRATAMLKLPRRTSHGMRSFYVNVLRSQGKSDAEIALRIGHQTGGKLIVKVYGQSLPYKLSWMPANGDPAWSEWLPGFGKRPEQLDLGI